MPKTDSAKIDAYIEALDPAKRDALTHIRTLIQSLAPDATEALVYGVPGFRLNKKPLVCYAAFKAHCGFYPMSPAILDTLAGELGMLRTAKGTIQFTPDQPIPDELIARILRARIDELASH